MIPPEAPLVSIVTPAYNAARYLDDLLRSVESQDYPRLEHIVIDDGSTDDGATIELLRRHPHVRWWSRSNRGQYATMNEGFRAATGDFITVISADDRYVDGTAISALAGGLIEHQDWDVAYGYTLHTDEDARPLPTQPYQRYPAWMLRYNLGCIFHCSLLVRRARLVADGLFFDESYRYIGDADWMARLQMHRYRFGRIERPIAAYRHHTHQVSVLANADQSALALRRAEHERFHRRQATNRLLKRLILSYGTFQQRRVTALTAWRRGGRAAVGGLVMAWLRRKYEGD
jgi:glycosyltransferase involved in cell wall biosynthesis